MLPGPQGTRLEDQDGCAPSFPSMRHRELVLSVYSQRGTFSQNGPYLKNLQNITFHLKKYNISFSKIESFLYPFLTLYEAIYSEKVIAASPKAINVYLNKNYQDHYNDYPRSCNGGFFKFFLAFFSIRSNWLGEGRSRLVFRFSRNNFYRYLSFWLARMDYFESPI
jgi:hypothetical protein